MPRRAGPRTIYFPSPAAFRAWLAEHHASAPELIVGYYKRSTGRPSLTWPESVDEALCYGWIDGVRRSVDASRYTIRFTPRRTTSIWSRINLERVRVLTAEGRMTSAGLAIHAARKDPDNPGYSVAGRGVTPFAPARERAFRKEKAAWRFFTSSAPSYQKNIRHYIESPKREETKEKRFAIVLAACKAGKKLGW